MCQASLLFYFDILFLIIIKKYDFRLYVVFLCAVEQCIVFLLYASVSKAYISAVIRKQVMTGDSLLSARNYFTGFYSQLPQEIRHIDFDVTLLCTDLYLHKVFVVRAS
jgi:hypothetical protein